MLDIMEPGDKVTLRPMEDGEILPGGDYVVAQVDEGDKSFRVEGHPRVAVYPHRIAALHIDSPRVIRPDARA